MVQDESGIRDQFEARLLPLLPALARTARFAAEDDEAGELTLEETVADAYRQYAGDLSEGEFRLWIFGRLIGALTSGGKDAGPGRSVSPREQADNSSRPIRYAEDPETLRSLRMRVKADLKPRDVREVARTLPVDVRTALALALAGELTTDEMAPVLNASPSVVRASVREGRRLMRRGLCDMLYTRPADTAPVRPGSTIRPTHWQG